MSSQGSTGQRVKNLIWVIVQFEILCLHIGFYLGIISSVVDFQELCWKRYNFDEINSSSVSTNVTIKANSNYSMNNVIDGVLVNDPVAAGYNSWRRANFQISENQILEIKAVGEISLCRSYLPLYHLQDMSDPLVNVGSGFYTRVNGDKIAIPRINENTEPLTLIFNARTKGWRNLAEVYNGDIVKVILKDNVSPGQVVAADPLLIPVSAADCNALSDVLARQTCLNGLNAGQVSASPVCAQIVDLTQRAACQAQFASTPPGPVGLTVAQFNRLPTSLIQQCINNIPQGGGSCATTSSTCSTLRSAFKYVGCFCD